ncbi:MAG TPA: efflux RND transporter periplasmic adaptor subunit [Thermoanaerobaculia bacterium]|jgi:RND family efflux transporter MFP subunit
MAIDKEALEGLRIHRTSEPARRASVPGWLIALIAVAVLAGAAWFFTRQRAPEVTVAQAKAVSTAGGSGGSVLNATGYVTARRRATVSAKVTGKVTEVHVEEGMRVKAGQELARLDEAYAAKGLALTQAQANAARSALEETRVRIRQAQLDLDRAKQLTQSQIASRADLDRAQAELDALRARLASLSDAYSVAQQQVTLQRQSVDDTIIRAPFDGVVVSKDAQPGEMISPVSAGGGFTRTGICTIVDMESLEIEVDVNEAYINRVQPNMRVEAVLDAYPDWRIPAHVITTVPTADRQKATVRVRIAFDQKDPRILPDMGVKVSFIAPESPGQAQAASSTMVEVPKSAIRRDGESDILFVVTEKKVERRAVKVLSTQGDVVRLASGVADGEAVVIEGPELVDGDSVKIKETK